MLIWKEMKSQGLTQTKLQAILREKIFFIRDLFKMDTIDPHMLIEISALLNTNFFQSFEPEDLKLFLKDDMVKISDLKTLIQDQGKLLRTCKKMIKEQEEMIKILQPKWLRE